MNLEEELENDFAEFEEQIEQKPVPTFTLNQNEYSIEFNPLFQQIVNNKELLPENISSEKLPQLFDLLEKTTAEVQSLHYLLLDLLSDKFAELESMIIDPEKYAEIVHKIFENLSTLNLNLDNILENQLAMAVILAFSRSVLFKSCSNGINQSEMPKFENIKTKSSQIINLSKAKLKILELASCKIEQIAPNTNKIIGPFLSCLLIGKAGGITQLSRIPSCNIQLMAGKKERHHGLSKHSQNLHFGYFTDLEVVRQTEEKYQPKLIKLLVNAVAKTARIDASRLSTDGRIGNEMKKDLLIKFEKYLAPKTGQMRQPLPAPDDIPKKRRGGRKFRRAKDQLALTEVRMNKNRIKFGEEFNEETGNAAEEMGMLSQVNSGVLRIHKKIQKINLTKSQRKRIETNNANAGNFDGLVSTLVFSNNQGINLVMGPSGIRK